MSSEKRLQVSGKIKSSLSPPPILGQIAIQTIRNEKLYLFGANDWSKLYLPAEVKLL
ncbi:MAG: hypothetical protein N2246_06550 [Candidatus Sumerlaeia bacterium]|nr:hypothetical protein [Candidatus Sumerlaeia bacterium]